MRPTSAALILKRILTGICNRLAGQDHPIPITSNCSGLGHRAQILRQTMILMIAAFDARGGAVRAELLKR